MNFNDFIRRLSASKPFEKPSDMPVLKDPSDRTVSDVLDFVGNQGEMYAELRRRPGTVFFIIDGQTIVPRAELLVGQVNFGGAA